MPVLLRAAKKCQLTEPLGRYVLGFMDTLPAFRKHYPGQPSYSQENLFGHFVRQDYNGHDALEDVGALQRLLQVALIPLTRLMACTFTFKSATTYVNFLDVKRLRVETLAPRLGGRLSASMIDKIATSGLTYQHLQLAVRRSGCEGLRRLLSEPNDQGKPRVTTCKRVLDTLCEYFVK